MDTAKTSSNKRDTVYEVSPDCAISNAKEVSYLAPDENRNEQIQTGPTVFEETLRISPSDIFLHRKGAPLSRVEKKRDSKKQSEIDAFKARMKLKRESLEKKKRRREIDSLAQEESKAIKKQIKREEEEQS